MNASQNDPLRKQKLAALFALAVLVRVGAMLALGTWGFSSADNHWAAGWETGRIASHLANGQGYAMELGPGWNSLAPTAWLAPLYPTLVGAVFWMFGTFTKGSLILILLLQILCDGGTCIQLARMGDRFGQRRAGICAGFLLALSPASINMSVRVLWCTSLLTFLCSTLIVRMLDHARADATAMPRAWIATGALIGFTLLTSPTPAIFVGFASLLLIAKNPTLNVRAVSTMAFVASLVVAPWIGRNYGEFKSMFFLKSNIGNELFIGNNPIADGSYQRAPDLARSVLSREHLLELRPMNELNRANRLGDHAMDWIGEHPEAFATLTRKRIGTYWTSPFLDQWDILPLGPLKGVVPPLYTLSRWLVLIAAAVGVVLVIRNRRNAGFLLGFLALFPLAYYVTHAGIARYRFPVVPGLFLLAAITFDTVWSQLIDARSPQRTAREPMTSADQGA